MCDDIKDEIAKAACASVHSFGYKLNAALDCVADLPVFYTQRQLVSKTSRRQRFGNIQI